MKVEAKIKEETDPAKMGKTQPPAEVADTRVFNDPMAGTVAGPSGQMNFRGNMQDVSQQTAVAVGTDPAAKKPEGIWTVRQTDTAGKQPAEARREGATGTPGYVADKDQPELITGDSPMPEVDSHKGPDQTAGPDTHLDMPEGDTTMHPTEPGKMTPKPPHECPDGQHWDADAAGCMPDVDLASEKLPSLEERRARVHAELKAKSSEEQALAWEQKHNEIYQKCSELLGEVKALKANVAEARHDRDSANQRLQNLIIEKQKAQDEYEHELAAKTRKEKEFDGLSGQHQALNKKYQENLGINLQLTKKLTTAHEDYLAIASEKELLEAKLSAARVNAKKTLKLKV